MARAQLGAGTGLGALSFLYTRSGEVVEFPFHGARVHDALVDVEGGGFDVVEDGFAHAESARGGEEERPREAGFRELDAAESGVTTPIAERLEEDARARP